MKKYICMAALFLSLIAGLGGCSRETEPAMTADILSVGKADCSILSDGTHTVIIDTGLESTADMVCQAIEKTGGGTIDLLILTHFDKDHIGGAAKILETFAVNTVVLPSTEPENPMAEAYLNLNDAIKETNPQCIYLTDTADYQFGNILLNLSGTNGVTYDKNTNNNSSVLVTVTHMGHTIFFAGDIEKQRIKDLLSAGGFFSCDILKFPHHGEYNSQTEAFVSALSPQYTVITCSEETLPDEKTIDVLDSEGCETFLTANGIVHIKSTRGQLSVMQ